MVSRRDFLRSGSVAGIFSALPVGAVLAQGQSPLAPNAMAGLVAICDTRYSEGNQFLTQVAHAAHQTHATTQDAGAVLAQLPEALAAGRPLLGLTTDATLVIVEQAAIARGYGFSFRGVHRHLSDTQIRHDITADERWLGELGKALQTAGSEWPKLLGELGAGLLARTTGQSSREFTATATRDVGSPGHLVSWGLVPAA